MIAQLIRWSIANRFLVLLATLMSPPGASGRCCARRSMRFPICRTCRSSSARPIPGRRRRSSRTRSPIRSPRRCCRCPGAKTVRGYSLFGDSFVYILFEDGTDPYWARSRVLEYLNQVQSRLPPQAKASLGPGRDRRRLDLRVRAGRPHAASMDLSQLRALQDWFLKYELKTVPNVSEVASIGGMVRQYQIVLDPDRLRAYNIPHGKVIDAVQKANQETGGSVLELGEAEYMVRASGYLQVARRLPRDSADARPTPACRCALGDVARIQVGPEMRRGIAELNGEGEVAGGVIVMRSGKNALRNHRCGEGEARGAEAQPAAGRRDRADLRPLQPHRARGRQPRSTS